MPQRTNEFQELVALIQRAYATEGATVTESKLEDVMPGDEREIDILIEKTVATYRIKIAVEAKDEKRPMDSVGFDKILGKYHLGCGLINKIVIVTHNGYTEKVVRKAKQYGIDLLTLKEAESFDWSKFVPQAVFLTSTFEIKNLQVKPEVEPQEIMLRDGIVQCACGSTHGPAINVAQSAVWKAIASKQKRLLEADKRVSQSGRDESLKFSGVVWPYGHDKYLLLNGIHTKIGDMTFDVVLHKKTCSQPFLQGNGFSFGMRICNYRLKPLIDGIDPKELLDKGRLVCKCCEKDHGLLSTQFHKTISPALKPGAEIWRQMQKHLQQHPEFNVAHADVMMEVDQRLRVKLEDRFFDIEGVIAVIHGERGESLKLKQFDLTDTDGERKTVTHFEAKMQDHTFTIVMPDGLKSQQIGFRIKHHGQKTNSKKKTKKPGA